MSIFSRTRDIFAANMTELLDRSEDPSRMIRMIILEMEETLVEVRASAARSIADGKEMRRAWKRLERRADFAEGRADALGMTGPKSLEEEIAELKASEKVDAELEAMKAARNAAAAKGD